MLSETLKTLLGDKSSLVREIGPDAFTMYLLLRSMSEERIDEDDWSWRNPEPPPGDPLVVFGNLFEMKQGIWSDSMTYADLEGMMSALRHSGWVYDYNIDDLDYNVVLGTHDRAPVYAIDERISEVDRRRAAITKPHPTARRKMADVSSRMKTAQKAAESAKEVAQELHEKKSEKIRKRQQAKRNKEVGETGTKYHAKKTSHYLNEDGTYRENQFGIAKMYEHMFIEAFRIDPPSVFRGSKSLTKHGRKLWAIASDFSPDEAMEIVGYAVQNWQELRKVVRVDEYPTPDAIWRLRMDLGMALRAGDDPVASFRKKHARMRNDRHYQEVNQAESPDRPEEVGEEWFIPENE